MIDIIQSCGRPETPGTRCADRSTVTSVRVRETLVAIEKAGGLVSWCILTPEENRVRVALLHMYAEGGRAPDVAQLAARAGLSVQEIRPLLASLQRSDAIVLDSNTGQVVGAYPFTDRETEHRVTLRATTLNAMCAIDALGIGAMYEEDAQIRSSCRTCATPIEIATQDRGRSIAYRRPETAVVWSGVRYEHGCAANSLCTFIAFFCSDAHLETWRETQAKDPRGFRLSIEEALETGRAIFGQSLGGYTTAANE